MSPPLALSVSPLGELGLHPGLGLLFGFVLIFLNGFFVAAEFALVKVRPTQMEPWAARNDRRGKVAYHMILHLDAYLSATQLGITLSSLGLGWIGEPAFARLLQPLFAAIPGATPAVIRSVSIACGFAIISILHIVLGELAPKSLAIRKPESTSLWVALPLFVFHWIAYPAIWILNHAANAFLRLFGLEPAAGELVHSEEEIRRLLTSSRRTHLPAQKRELLGNVLELSHRIARQAMVPRADVVYMDVADSMEKSLEIAKTSGHTRFPLCDQDLDRVMGLVHIKDLFRAEAPPASLQEVRRDITFVPETFPLDRLLRRMRDRRIHLAAVLDEYGSVSGIVSLENVIEKIVGEIQDEFDAEVPELVRLEEGVYQVSGSMLIDELEDALKVALPGGREEDTMAGVVLSELGRRARVGDKVEVGTLQMEVLEVKGHRIQTLRVGVQPAAKPEPDPIP